MLKDYVPPQHRQDAFNCPCCHAYSEQGWIDLYTISGLTQKFEGLDVAICTRCRKASIWVKEKMLYPASAVAPPASDDMPADVREEYDEAAAVYATSPKSSAALLRLAVQRLCVHLGEKGKKIDEDIGALVAKGLPPKIQKALDIVRVIGNDSVHPGTIDVNDNPEIAMSLFGLLNLIVDEMITRPKEIDALYSALPANKLKGIEDRDKNSLPPASTT